MRRKKAINYSEHVIVSLQFKRLHKMICTQLCMHTTSTPRMRDLFVSDFFVHGCFHYSGHIPGKQQKNAKEKNLPMLVWLHTSTLKERM